jgi:outer membrane protein assembly factor BamB
MAIRHIATLCVALMAAGGAVPSPGPASGDGGPLFAGGVLHQGDSLRSGDGCMELRFFSADGYYTRLDLRGVDGCGTSNWDSYSDYDWSGIGRGIHASADEPRGSRAAEAVMQYDGNFVVYDLETGTPVWATHTDGHPGAFLNVQGDGNLVVYSAEGEALWSLF